MGLSLIATVSYAGGVLGCKGRPAPLGSGFLGVKEWVWFCRLCCLVERSCDRGFFILYRVRRWDICFGRLDVLEQFWELFLLSDKKDFVDSTA